MQLFDQKIRNFSNAWSKIISGVWIIAFQHEDMNWVADILVAYLNKCNTLIKQLVERHVVV